MQEKAAWVRHLTRRPFKSSDFFFPKFWFLPGCQECQLYQLYGSLPEREKNVIFGFCPKTPNPLKVRGNEHLRVKLAQYAGKSRMGTAPNAQAIQVIRFFFSKILVFAWMPGVPIVPMVWLAARERKMSFLVFAPKPQTS